MTFLYLAACDKKNEHQRARALAIRAARDAFGVACTLQKDARGKPYFPASPYYVSLSHTDGICLAAVSQQPIGVDIERIQVRDAAWKRKLANRFFSPDEAQAVQKNPDDFYRIWTAKESFVKLTGEGFSRPFPSFSIFRQDGYRFDTRILAQYTLTVCRHTADELFYQIIPFNQL